MSPTRPLLIFLPDPKQWFERAVPSVRRKEFLERVEAKLDQLDGPIAFIASRTNEEEFEFDDKIRLVMSHCVCILHKSWYTKLQLCVLDAYCSYW